MWNSRSEIFTIQPSLFKMIYIYIDTYVEFHIWNLYYIIISIQDKSIQGLFSIIIDIYIEFQIWSLYYNHLYSNITTIHYLEHYLEHFPHHHYYYDHLHRIHSSVFPEHVWYDKTT